MLPVAGTLLPAVEPPKNFLGWLPEQGIEWNGLVGLTKLQSLASSWLRYLGFNLRTSKNEVRALLVEVELDGPSVGRLTVGLGGSIEYAVPTSIELTVTGTEVTWRLIR